ncbi:phosphoesterase family-domain-containing protein [Linnemannia elongata]|nr:phosphoesterase family-domain-containing protein [Linnemannia elongata]
MILKQLFPLAAIFASALITTFTHAAEPDDLSTIHHQQQQPPKGKAFDHILIILLENTNYALAASDPYLQHLSQTGILLTNYHALTHPSQPNYIASIAGDYYGLNKDHDCSIPANYSTIVDLLEPKHLTWKTYQEDMPEICYKSSYTGDGLYFRKHNPFVTHESIAGNATRCKNVVPASQLPLDLFAAASSSSTTTPETPLPNYMYYTPNMINNGHNTTVRDASLFLSTFLPPLLTSPAILHSNTLVAITFDETEDYTIGDNLVYTLLLGSNDLVMPPSLKNTTDSTFYTHYSLLSTVESNWDLGNLGRNDANKKLANVFKLVADRTGYQNLEVATTIADVGLFNETIPGFLTGVPHRKSSSHGSPASSPSHANTFILSSSTILVTIAFVVAATV